MIRRARQSRSRGQVPLRAFSGLDGWWLTNGGIEAQRAISVGGARLTVCYKVHIIPARRTKYKASITLWPRARRRLTSRRQPGWHPDLVRTNWYEACGQEFRRRGYRGSWRWSPWGRFGDFWKSLNGAGSLAREAQKLERLRRGFGLPR
jgi:hypothetical protein